MDGVPDARGMKRRADRVRNADEKEQMRRKNASRIQWKIRDAFFMKILL